VTLTKGTARRLMLDPRAEQAVVDELIRTHPHEDLDGRFWDTREPDGPVYTGMVDENTDPFVPSGALKVKIAEAQTWEPPEGCTCIYGHPDGRIGGKRPCPVRGHQDT
jgi:hypothetical protein